MKEEFLRHEIVEEEVKCRRFLFRDEERVVAEEMFSGFFNRVFNLFINDVSWGRGQFEVKDDTLVFEVDESFFKTLVVASTLEFSIIDGMTLEIRSFEPITKSIDSLTSGNPMEMITAIRTIGRGRMIAGIPHIFPLLNHKNHEIRVAVVRALSTYEQRSEIEPQLLRMLKDIDENVRSRTCDALVKYPSKNVIAALITAVEDPSTTVSWAARLALREMNVEGYTTAELEL
jgi:hypothetical protein